MANEPTGAPSPESRPEHSAEKTGKTAKPVSDASSTPSDGQTELFTREVKPAAAPAEPSGKPKTSGIQIQPASDTVARTEGSAPVPSTPSETKPCPTDEEGRLLADEPATDEKPVTTTEGTDGQETSGHSFDDDNPYHQETTDYHHDHDDYHHDDYHHQDPHHDDHHNDPYHYQQDDHGSGGGGGWVPPSSTGSGSGDSPSEEHDPEEEGGGPIKGFIDHLEDLRWMLIKCVAAVLVCIVVCLVASNLIVSVLLYPLKLANEITVGKPDPMVVLTLGTNEIWLPVTTNDFFAPIPIGTNKVVGFDLVPQMVGTNLVLGLKHNPHPPEGQHRNVKVTILGPGEVFGVMMDICLYGGVGLASPFILLFVGQFVFPALKKKERDWLVQGVVVGAGLFMFGVAFCYFLLMKVTLFATAEIAEWMGFATEQWRAGEYISFMCKFLIGMGVSFELPVLLLTLVKIGLLSYQRMASFRSYMVVILLIISALVTPTGDPFTMILMAAPLYVLYEASILVAYIWHRRELREQAALAKAEREGK